MAQPRSAIGAFIRGLPWYRFAAGVLAGGAGLLVTFLLRAFGLGVFLPEVAVDFVVGRIPGSIESFFIRTLGEGAKGLALLIALAVFLVLPGVYAVFFRSIQRRLKNRWVVLAFYALSSAGIVLLGILPILDAGFLGSAAAVGAGFASFSQLVGAWTFAAVLDYLLVDVASRHPQGFKLSRRQFIAGGVAAIAFAALAFYGLASLAGRKGRLVFASIAEMFAKEITPTPEFYVVTKNVIDPTVDASTWRLAIGGLVATPASYSYAEVLGLATADEIVTLECVSNEIGGNLISTAEWRGVRLASLLQAAGVDPAADWVVFTCADGYTVAIPMSKALEPKTLLAVRMNGAPLTTAHGYPSRIIVPGLYGMFHAKWITRIEPAHGEYRGFWQQKGWTNGGEIHTRAIIATPPDNAVVDGPVTIGGVAFAGDRGISRVEISTDGGANWAEASLRLPPKSDVTWVLWTYDWTPTRGGSFRIVARATDGAGVLQDPNPVPPFPDGAVGRDSVTLLVAQ